MRRVSQLGSGVPKDRLRRQVVHEHVEKSAAARLDLERCLDHKFSLPSPCRGKHHVHHQRTHVAIDAVLPGCVHMKLFENKLAGAVLALAVEIRGEIHDNGVPVVHHPRRGKRWNLHREGRNSRVHHHILGALGVGRHLNIDGALPLPTAARGVIGADASPVGGTQRGRGPVPKHRVAHRIELYRNIVLGVNHQAVVAVAVVVVS